MKLGIDEAWKYQLLTYPNPAVGCVVLKDGKLLSIEAHKEAGMPHAEVNALKTALLSKESNSLLRALTKSSEIHEYLIKNNNASGVIKTLENENINMTTKVLEKECENLLIPFKYWQNKTSIFFKMAQTLNGSIDGQISSQRAKLYVHTLRDKIDLLLIGGNTIRTDKPTLDTRYIKGREPDIFIYSKSKAFSQNIPLFKVPNRKVIISDDLFKLLDYKCVIGEGVYSLLDILKDKIDFFIVIISPKIRNGVNALNELNIDFEILHENYLGDEKIVFLKKKS